MLVGRGIRKDHRKKPHQLGVLRMDLQDPHLGKRLKDLLSMWRRIQLPFEVVPGKVAVHMNSFNPERAIQTSIDFPLNANANMVEPPYPGCSPCENRKI